MKCLAIEIPDVRYTVLCNNQCDDCRWRFMCFTTKEGTISIEPTAEELSSFGIVDSIERRGNRLILCPHCTKLFVITSLQITNNLKFKCRRCGKYNYGATKSDNFGTLIGETHDITRY